MSRIRSRGNRDTELAWSEADGAYVGHCPDLFPRGGVCHGATQPDLALQVEGRLGRDSRFDLTFGCHAAGVSPTTARRTAPSAVPACPRLRPP